MKEFILNFPQQFKEGLKLAENIDIRGKYSNIVVSGMGGSALPTELINTCYNLNLTTNRNYKLPDIKTKTLCIFCSYSGNTEECLYAYKEAIKRNIDSICITSGGMLRKLSIKNKTKLILLPENYPPRLACGFVFSIIAKILYKLKLITDLKDIEKLGDRLKPEIFGEEGKKIADRAYKKIPLIYASEKYKSVAYIWKINFNENSKIPSFCNSIPEMNHNEINGFTNKICNFYTIILRDKKDNRRILKRIEITKKLVNEKNAEIIDFIGRNIFEKVFNSVILSYWASYYLALKYKIDPIKVEMIDKLKELLQEV